MRTAISLAALSGSSAVIQFTQLWFVMTTIGPGEQTDALFAGMIVPQLVLAIVSGSLSNVLVPLLASEHEATFRKDAWSFFIAAIAFFGAIAVVLALASHYWVPLIVPGLSPEAKHLAERLTRIQLVGMVGTAAVSVLWSVCCARRRFIRAESSPVAANALALVFLIWALPQMGVSAGAWSYVLSAILQVVFLCSMLGAPVWPDFRSPALSLAGQRIKPLVLGTVYYKSDLLVDRFLASLAPPGAISLLHFGLQCYGAANLVLNKALAAPMIPSLALHSTKEEWLPFRTLYRSRLIWVLALTGSGYLAFAVIGEPVLKLLIGHGGVSRENVHTLWWIMLLLGGVLIGGATGQVLANAFYAKGDTGTPTRIGVFGFTLGIGFKVAGFAFAGIGGLAAGATLYYLFNSLVMNRYLENSLRQDIDGNS